jgi:Zn-dependent M16 (insulinase) family peptidase
MNAKAALCAALLRGEVVSIRTGFFDLGITNVPREVSREVEKPFGVTVSRTKKNGQSRWGVDCTWHEYHLNKTEYNKPGIELMRAYVREQTKDFKQRGRDPGQKQKFSQMELL